MQRTGLARTRPRPWIPRDLNGCVLWVRGQERTTIGTGVSAWGDLSLAGNDLSQGTGSSQPTLLTNTGPSGKRWALSYVTGTSLGEQCADASHLNWERTQPWTALIVYNPTSYPSNGAWIISKGQPLGGAAPGWGIQCGSATNIRVAISNSVSSRLVVDATVPSQTGNWNLLIVSYDGSSTPAGITGRLNGSALSFGTTVNSLSSSIISASPFQVGGKIPTLNDYDGKIGEVVMTSNVTSTINTTRLEKFGNGHWGIF